MSRIAESFKEHREAYGLTQTALGQATGISQQKISYYEKGLHSIPIEDCITLADFYGISLDELIGRDFIPNQNTLQKTVNQNIKDNHGTITNKF